MHNQQLPIGQTYRVDLGQDLVFNLKFDSANAMQMTGLAGPKNGRSSAARISTTSLAEGVWLVSWQDGDGNTFVQVLDFQSQGTYLELTLPDNLEGENTKLLHLKGALQPVADF